MWYWKNIIIPETQKWHRGVTRACLTRVPLSWSEVLVTMVTEIFKLENHTLKVAKKVFPELLSSCSLCLFVHPFLNPGTLQKIHYEVTWTLQAGKKAWVLMLCHTSQNIKIWYLDLRLGPEKTQDNWIGLDLFNDDTRPSGHISRPTQVNVSQNCFHSLNNYSSPIILSSLGASWS